jgi:hypothetical protein
VRIWGAALTPPEIIALILGQPPEPAPKCVASSARETVRARRRTTLVVTVRRNGTPLNRVRVLLRGMKTRLVRSRGRARFIVRPQRSEKRLQVRVLGRSCQNTSVAVRR